MSRGAGRRALIVKLGAIGDVVMAIPAAYAMHQRGYAVEWICGEGAAPVLRLYPWIRVIEVSERALLRGSLIEQTRAMVDAWRKICGRRYDLCATLYYDARYALLALPVRASRRVRLSGKGRETAALAERHFTDEYARLLQADADGERPAQLAPVPAEGLTKAALGDGSRRVMLVPAGARNLLRDNPLRRWPLDRYVELAKRLIERGCEVALLGGPDDGWASESFAGVPVTDHIGRLSLVESLAMLSSAAVTVTHDTGPLHLAGITQTAIVAIFGPTNPNRFMPARENCVALWGGEGFACRPCYDGREFAPCTNNGCVQQITVEMVLGEVEKMLEARRSGRALPPRVVLPEHTPVIRWSGEGFQ